MTPSQTDTYEWGPHDGQTPTDLWLRTMDPGRNLPRWMFSMGTSENTVIYDDSVEKCAYQICRSDGSVLLKFSKICDTAFISVKLQNRCIIYISVIWCNLWYFRISQVLRRIGFYRLSFNSVLSIVALWRKPDVANIARYINEGINSFITQSNYW